MYEIVGSPPKDWRVVGLVQEEGDWQATLRVRRRNGRSALLRVDRQRGQWAEDKVVFVETKDPELILTIRTARAELERFLALASDLPVETSGFKLKVMVRGAESTEHLWVTPCNREFEEFAGTLRNDPRVVRNVTAGSLATRCWPRLAQTR